MKMTKGVAKVIGSYKAWSISVDTVDLAAEGGKVKIKGGQNIITTPPPDFFSPQPHRLSWKMFNDKWSGTVAAINHMRDLAGSVIGAKVSRSTHEHPARAHTHTNPRARAHARRPALYRRRLPTVAENSRKVPSSCAPDEGNSFCDRNGTKARREEGRIIGGCHD